MQVFGQKLKEELNREREAFIVKLENDPQQALEEYGYTEIETGTVLDILTSNDSNEGVDELVTQFIEKIEQEASAKDTAISKGVANEWKSIQSNIQDSQQTRSRNIISEIIKTTKHFYDAIGKYFTPKLQSNLAYENTSSFRSQIQQLQRRGRGRKLSIPVKLNCLVTRTKERFNILQILLYFNI